MALLFALMLEQVRPLSERNWVHDGLRQWGLWVRHALDTGRLHHSALIWGLAVGVPALLSLLVHVLLLSLLGWPFAMLWAIAVLYVTLGFRQFSHHFTDIRDALDRGDEHEARRLLAEWQDMDAVDLPRTELLRHVIEHSLLAAHRHVFGVFFWFVVLSALGLGPAGAVFYRMAYLTSRFVAARLQGSEGMGHETLMDLSNRLFVRLDHVPARLTAFGFAVVGNFEEAVNGWRRDAPLWKHANEGIILSAAAGAVGVRLGGQGSEASSAEGSTPGAQPQLGHLQSMVALVWRSVVLWLLLVPIFSSAHFYFVHRLLHWPPLYSRVHALHHRSINIGPWSGLSMHPVESVIYASAVLIHFVIPTHPVIFLVHIYIKMMGPAFSHAGFESLLARDKRLINAGDFHHQLHHRYFECNYGTPEAPWDRWFGSFHDGTEAANARIKERRRQMMR